jgi:hypothetical protein
LNVNKLVQCKFCQIVLLNDPLGKLCEWHLHVFEAIKGGSQVKVLDVQADEFGALDTENAIPHHF